MNAAPVFIFGLFIVAAAFIVILSFYFARKRREAMARLARRLGLRFSPKDPLGIPKRFKQFGALSRGDSRRGCNVLRGEYGGRELIAFDYKYSTGSGKNRSTHHLSAAVVVCECRFPELVIRPENFFDKLAGLVGFEDIDFESDEFSRRFHVKSRDRKFAYDVIHQKTMEYLLRRSGWSIEMDGRDVLIWTGRRWKEADFEAAFHVLDDFLNLIPNYLWEELGAK